MFDKWTPDKKIGNYSGGTVYTNDDRVGKIISVRVIDIILDNKHELFEEFGNWNSIGTIFFDPVKNPNLSISKTSKKLIAAYPLLSNIKQYPLINEIVSIVYLADVDVTEKTTSVSPYYLPPINIWNSQIHNAVPSSNILSDNQKKDYQQVEAGSTRRVTDQSTEIELGNTFNENNVLNVFPLLPYEGDIIYEGRYGNSIRLGATVNNSTNPNLWSSIGNNGSPIMILRNGQSFDQFNVGDTKESWIPCVENINEDQSSIYLTSTQNVPLNLSSPLKDSYNKTTAESPAAPKDFSGNQILLSSGRLVFNAKNDHIILSSNKSIHLTAQTSINLDGSNLFSTKADQVIITSPSIYLGSNTPASSKPLHPLVLGENLIDVLNTICIALDIVSTAFAGASVPSDTGNLAVPSLVANSGNISTKASELRSLIGSKQDSRLLSKTTKTI
jgi:hypothetical protein